MAATIRMLIAKRALQKRLGSDAPSWACDQLTRGRDTPHLRILAGFTGNENDFELSEVFDRSLGELGISVPPIEQALIGYALELTDDYSQGQISKEFLLETLCQICIDTDYLKVLYPFYLLRWTWDDLKTAEFSFHLYDATRENFDNLLNAEILKLQNAVKQDG